MPPRSKLWIYLGLGLIAVSVYYWQSGHNSAPVAAGAGPAASAQAGVPATVTKAKISDFDVYVTSLGTVQAYATVTVRSRIDGELLKAYFSEGQFVKKDDLIAQIDPRPYRAALEQANAKKTQDQVNLENAKLDLERYLKLGEFAARQQLDTQRATVSQITAQLAADDAAIDLAQTQLDYATIKTPISGRAGFKLVDEGNIVNAANTNGLVVIEQMRPISVIFTQSEAYIHEINAGLASTPQPVDALSSDGKSLISTGKLSFVDNLVDTSTGTIHLKATFGNEDLKLWPGMSVSTRLLLKTLKNVLIVPTNAVQHGPAGLFVYQVDDQNKVQVQPVEIGPANAGYTVVTKGVAEGQTVVVDGQYRLQNGVKIAPADYVPPSGLAQSQ